MIPGVVAHLWQSTLFTGAAWLTTLAMRTNRAQVRYWLWFAASVKFLFPFSLLVGLGTLMPHHSGAPTIRADWVSMLQEFGQPLTLPTVAAPAAVTTDVTNHDYLAAAALAFGACGFAAVAIGWLPSVEACARPQTICTSCQRSDRPRNSRTRDVCPRSHRTRHLRCSTTCLAAPGRHC